MPTTTFRCIECGTPVQESSDGAAGGRKPCPKCGSVGREIVVVQTETVGISDSVITKVTKTAQGLLLAVMPLSGERAMSGFLRPDGIFEPLGVGHPLKAIWRALQELRKRLGPD